jgi:hypothetical protein
MTERKKSPLHTQSVEPHMCTVDLRLEILGRVPFFSELSAEELGEINRLIHERGHLLIPWLVLSWLKLTPYPTNLPSLIHFSLSPVVAFRLPPRHAPCWWVRRPSCASSV